MNYNNSVYQHHDNDRVKEILTDFHHLLQFHDSEIAFEQIYEEIKDCHHNKGECNILKRTQRRRARASTVHEPTIVEDEKEIDSARDVMDKIHAFYHHSYDRSLRK